MNSQLEKTVAIECRHISTAAEWQIPVNRGAPIPCNVN
jgi:hypothetical protein